MDRKMIQEKVESIVKETLACTGQLEENANLLRRLHLDSMSFMTIVLRIENEFGIEFGEEYLIIDNFRTISSLVSHIQKRLQPAGQ